MRRSGMLTGMVIGAVLAVVAVVIVPKYIMPKGTIVDSMGEGLTLPGEVQRRVVTREEIESVLAPIDEISTYYSKYTVTLGKDQTRYFFENVAILGTTNHIELTCDGVVKVGYNISDIGIEIEEDKIYVSLPAPKVNDNYLIWDSVQCTEKNNILNPIKFSQYQDLIAEIEKKGLEEAEADGIYAKADENLKVIIEGFLAEFEGYKIVFR